jgi:hypothetical protein
LYHGIFTTFQRHNSYSYNSDEKALIISLLRNCKLVRTPPTVSKNAEVASWWKGSSKSDSFSLHSMMFEDNVGEDGLSAQSSYTIDRGSSSRGPAKIVFFLAGNLNFPSSQRTNKEKKNRQTTSKERPIL